MDRPGTTAPRRLTLSGPQWALLCRRVGADPPAGFGAGADVPEDELADAEAALVDRGLLAGADRAVHPSVLANLAVWAAPDLLVRMEISVRGAGLRAVYAVRGQLGGSLLTLPDHRVELSMFPAVRLGTELSRGVPEASQLPGGGRIGTALAAGADRAAPVRGRLPLAALAEYGPASAYSSPRAAGAALGLSDEEVRLAGEVTARTLGVLRCLVTGGARASRAAGGMPVAEVVWLATDAGWVGLRPRPDGSGRQLVELVPVGADAIGAWLAPYLARILEVVGD